MTARRRLAALIASAAAVLLVAAVSSCARMGQPDGGWYDETPPRVLHATPADGATGVNTQKISIHFDEYVKLDDAATKVVVSPPQIEMPEIRTAGKEIKVELKDSLKPGMTYTIDFSDAVTDNNEGNPMGNYTYSFSTGGQIDTLEVSGTVLDASNLEPIKGILVGLYSDLSDTAFTTKPMLRVSRTDSRGRFIVRGVAPGAYRAYALQDMDGNYLYSQKSEMLAFSHDSIVPWCGPDTRQDTIWRDSLRIDSITRTPYIHFYPDDIVLRAFTATQTDRYLLKTERKDVDRIGIYFTSGSDTIKEDVKSLIKRLVIAFALDNNVSTQLDFTLRALIRLPEELDVSDNSALVLDILGMSDIALEITSPGRDLLSVYVISGGDGTSTLYIASDAEGIIGGKIAVPGIDLGSLIASTETPSAPEGGEEGGAVTSTEGDATTETPGEETDILGTIFGLINRIYVTNDEARVNFGANLLVTLLNLLLPGYELDEENFLQLDPEGSFVSVFYGMGEEGRDIGIELSIAPDPMTIGITLGDLGVSVNDASASVIDEAELAEYKNIYDDDVAVSLDTTLSLELTLLNTEELENGELPIGDILSALTSAIMLDLGVAIRDDLSLAVDVRLGANIYFNDPEKTEVMLELRDGGSADGTLILGAYVRGDVLYVDLGMISEGNRFKIENTALVSTVLDAVNGALATAADDSATSEAVTATDGTETVEPEKTPLDIILEISEGHLALNVTEAVLLGVIGAVAGTDADIDGIFDALDLGAEVSVAVDFDRPAVSVEVFTKYANIAIAIEEPYVSNSVNADVNDAPAAMIAMSQTSGSNALNVMSGVQEVMEQIRANLPDDMKLEVQYDSTEYVQETIKEIILTLFMTLALVIFVCYLFLQDWRTTLVPTVAIPVSLLGTFAALLAVGYTINTLSLFGLVLVIGTVDSSSL